MQWASAWSFTHHAGVNPMCFCCCDDDEKGNSGGQSSTASAQTIPRRRRAKVNPLVRVMRADDQPSDRIAIKPAEDVQPFEYATEVFGGRRSSAFGVFHSRGLRRDRSRERATSIDDQVTVSFQKFLRDEMNLFLLMVIAATDEDDCCR